MDRFFWNLVERRPTESRIVEGFLCWILGGGGPVFVSHRLFAQGQGPFGSVRMGRLLSKSPTDNVHHWDIILLCADSSSLAAVGIHGSAHFGNGNYGDAHGTAFRADVRYVLKEWNE